MAQYTVKCKFMTAKAGRSASSIVGGSATGEIDITVDGPFDIDKMKTDNNLIEGCKQEFSSNPGFKGCAIIGLEILEIIEKK